MVHPALRSPLALALLAAATASGPAPSARRLPGVNQLPKDPQLLDAILSIR